MPTGAKLFVDSLLKLGINEIFTLVGDHLNEALWEADQAGLHIIDMRHESGVTHAADAWARIHRKPALSLVTGGPGHTNALTGIATAYLAASPLIAVSGSRSSTLAERQAFQDIDQIGMTRTVVKWAAEPPNAAQIPFYLGRAYAEANSGRKGPVYLTIPVDVFAGTTDSPMRVPLPPPESTPVPGAPEVDRALALLKSAERPVVIAGSGIWWAEAEAEIQQFIEATSLPLYTITMAKGAVSDSHPFSMGYADPAMNQSVHTVFKEADVVLMLGKRIDYRLALGGPRLFSPGTKFIQVDIHPQELGMNRPLEVAICADVKATLRAFLASIGEKAWPALPWVDRCRALRTAWEAKVAEAALDGSTPMHPAAFYAELKKALPPDVLHSWDGGDFAHWGRASIPALAPGRWLRLGPLGTIGSALPNCVALQLANPGKPVVMITGDGSLGFYLAELDTLVRHKLPVVIIVGNDACWGLEKILQSEATGMSRTVACDLAPSRYDLIMKAFGGGGETVETLDQVVPSVHRAFESGVPYLINVTVRGVRSPFTMWNLMGKKKQ